jgi:hypothetical protein
MSTETEVILEYLRYTQNKPQALRDFIDTVITQINRMNRVKDQGKKEKFVQTTAYIIKIAYSELLIDFTWHVKNNYRKSHIRATDFLANINIKKELQAVEELWTLTTKKELKALLFTIIKDFRNRFASDVVATCYHRIKNLSSENN